jgi:hypothetical protein
MKNIKSLLLIGAALLALNISVSAQTTDGTSNTIVIGEPVRSVPDTGGTVALVGLSVLGVYALKRKLRS